MHKKRGTGAILTIIVLILIIIFMIFFWSVIKNVLDKAR